jgi:katanin p60 ATPase-containing subunit A1
MKSELLTKLEGIGGASDKQNIFVLSATNLPWELDDALLRRFQKRIYISLPEEDAREQILRANLDGIAIPTFSYEKWSQMLNVYSCADVENLCRDAAHIVFERKMSSVTTNEWLKMPTEDTRVVITDQIFADVIKTRKTSVDPTTIEKYEIWKRQFGAE